MTNPRHRLLICSRCGKKQPTEGPLTTDDGTPISVLEYVTLAGLVDGALVCSGCVPASAAGGGDWVSAGTPRRPSPGVLRRP